MPLTRNGGAKLHFFSDLPKVTPCFLGVFSLLRHFLMRMLAFIIYIIRRTYISRESHSLAGLAHQVE